MLRSHAAAAGAGHLAAALHPRIRAAPPSGSARREPAADSRSDRLQPGVVDAVTRDLGPARTARLRDHHDLMMM